jgi:hypothetical protein
MVLWSFGLISALPPRRGRVPWTSVVLVTLRETARLLLGAAAARACIPRWKEGGIYRYLAVMGDMCVVRPMFYCVGISV